MTQVGPVLSSTRDFYLRLNFGIDLFRLMYNYVHTYALTRLDEERNTNSLDISTNCLGSKVIRETVFAQKRCFDISWPPQPTLDR